MLKHQPYARLKGKMREKGLTAKDVANVLNVSETTVYHKINGISDFYISECFLLESKLGLMLNFFN